jgi:hypothetical protein
MWLSTLDCMLAACFCLFARQATAQYVQDYVANAAAGTYS